MRKMSSTQASGTSGNKHNLNPGCDEYISKLHSILDCMKSSDTRMKFYDNVQNEHGRKKVQTLDFAIHTRWNSDHSETMCGTSNQYDLDVAIRKITCEVVIYDDIFRLHSENTDKILTISDDWVLWAHYATVMACIKQYSELS